MDCRFLVWPPPISCCCDCEWPRRAVLYPYEGLYTLRPPPFVPDSTDWHDSEIAAIIVVHFVSQKWMGIFCEHFGAHFVCPLLGCKQRRLLLYTEIAKEQSAAGVELFLNTWVDYKILYLIGKWSWSFSVYCVVPLLLVELPLVSCNRRKSIPPFGSSYCIR